MPAARSPCNTQSRPFPGRPHSLWGADALPTPSKTRCGRRFSHDAPCTHGRGKGVSGLFLRCGAERRQYVQQRVNACAVQSRAHHCRTKQAPPHQCGAALPGGLRVIAAADKIILHQRFVRAASSSRQRPLQCPPRRNPARTPAHPPPGVRVPPPAFRQHQRWAGPPCSEKHHGHVVLPQQPPDGLRMGLYALHTAYHQYRAVHGPDAALHLAAEIRVAGCRFKRNGSPRP